MELPRDPPWPWRTSNKLETPTAREIMLFSPRQAESCSSLVTHHGLGSRSMREEAFSMEGYHNASAASNASTLQWPASTLPGPTVATSGTKFSECINTLVACIYFSNRGNKQREIQRAHTRETCAPCDSDVDVCSPSCRGNFNKTTSCTWPRTSSTCSTTPS